MTTETTTDVLILGAGSAGLQALREVQRAGCEFLLIDPCPAGAVGVRAACLASKAALHAGAEWTASGRDVVDIEHREAFAIHLRAAWQRVRSHYQHFAGAAVDEARRTLGERLLQGRARFVAPTRVAVQTAEGRRCVRARRVIIATGSRPVMPKFLRAVRQHTVNTDEIFRLETLPRRVGVLGLGPIGLELALALARLGIDVVGVDAAATVAGVRDDQVAQRARQRFADEFRLWLGAEACVTPTATGVRVGAAEKEADVDLLLATLGRRPNIDDLNLGGAGFPLNDDGSPRHDAATLQVHGLPVFIAGDAGARCMQLHAALAQGRAAGYNATHEPTVRFVRQVPISISFSDPDVVVVGAQLDALDPGTIVIGACAGHESGRAVIFGGRDSLLRIYADARDGRLLGAAAVAVRGEHLAQVLVRAIQRGDRAQDLLATVFYHPSIEDMLQTALRRIVAQLPAESDLPWGLQAERRQRAA